MWIVMLWYTLIILKPVKTNQVTWFCFMIMRCTIDKMIVDHSYCWHGRVHLGSVFVKSDVCEHQVPGSEDELLLMHRSRWYSACWYAERWDSIHKHLSSQQLPLSAFCWHRRSSDWHWCKHSTRVKWVIFRAERSRRQTTCHLPRKCLTRGAALSFRMSL